MSPEQARGDALDVRSDLFSLGSVMYAMCAGRPPFRADISYGILRHITDSEPRPLQEINADVPGWLQQLINRLLSKSPNDRLQSAREAAEILQQCLAHVQQPTLTQLPTSLQSTDLGAEPGESRPAPRALLAVLLGMAVVATVTVTVSNLGSRGADEPDALTQKDAGLQSNAPVHSPTADWTGAQPDFDSLDDELTQFESLSRSLWDDATSSDPR